MPFHGHQICRLGSAVQPLPRHTSGMLKAGQLSEASTQGYELQLQDLVAKVLWTNTSDSKEQWYKLASCKTYSHAWLPTECTALPSQ